MLKLSMLPEDYLTINGDIGVQLARVAGGRADVAIHARREVPIVRGEVLERQGGQRPACLAAPAKKKARYRRDQVFRWNDDRERAVKAMRRVMDRLEQNGSADEARMLRLLLDRIVPAVWEDDLAEGQ